MRYPAAHLYDYFCVEDYCESLASVTHEYHHWSWAGGMALSQAVLDTFPVLGRQEQIASQCPHLLRGDFKSAVFFYMHKFVWEMKTSAVT